LFLENKWNSICLYVGLGYFKYKWNKEEEELRQANIKTQNNAESHQKELKKETDFFNEKILVENQEKKLLVEKTEDLEKKLKKLEEDAKTSELQLAELGTLKKQLNDKEETIKCLFCNQADLNEKLEKSEKKTQKLVEKLADLEKELKKLEEATKKNEPQLQKEEIELQLQQEKTNNVIAVIPENINNNQVLKVSQSSELIKEINALLPLEIDNTIHEGGGELDPEDFLLEAGDFLD
jgi:chromosome segregation ATPase